MVSSQERLSRWRETQTPGADLASLQHAVRYNGASSPCVLGCRSVCWKMFLLSGNVSVGVSWTQTLDEGRRLYTEHRGHFLKYINHPEALAEATIDPLADDPDSPWHTVRQDEVIRTEINQDVQRLPDEATYHEEQTQTMILDILFMYCKLFPDRGGYRQGMHELLAPLLYVIQQDALDLAAIPSDVQVEADMAHALDATFIEHDAFILFSRIMDHAQSFYEVKDVMPNPALGEARSSEQSSAIVERSKFIHEVCLQKVDPELAAHLTSIEILPQIFLIRWIRLLFSREFPFEQFLVLWDTIFAVDPSLELVDLICVAMLIRIRWDLFEADYSVCLQLLLKYPAPIEPHGPHTFVDDAIYLRNHLTPSGGASLIMKYTGKMPSVTSPPDTSRPSTPSFRGFNSFRQRKLGAKSPIPSPSRFIQQQGGMEALFQGAAKGAKGVLERGEKLGINQAVRDAMGEIRRNINEARHSAQSPRAMPYEDGAASGTLAMEKRNRQLAAMLEDTISNLRAVSGSDLDDKAKALEAIEIAAAKIQFVKVYLEDSSMEVPSLDTALEETPRPSIEINDMTNEKEGHKTGSGQDTLGSVDVDVGRLDIDDEVKPPKALKEAPISDPDRMDLSADPAVSDPIQVSNAKVIRPGPVPTRSTLAQSSFSWMLEPDESVPSQTPSVAASGSKSPPPQHKKRTSGNISREKNAFLFGEITSNAEGRNPLNSDEIFGLEPIQKPEDK